MNAGQSTSLISILKSVTLFECYGNVLCSLCLDRFSIQPLTILGVTGPFSVLAENIYSLCISSFDASVLNPLNGIKLIAES